MAYTQMRFHIVFFFSLIDPFHIVTSLSNRSLNEKSIKSIWLYEGADRLLVTLSKHIMMLNKSIFGL